MVASKRLPASFFRPVSIGWPLYQILAMVDTPLVVLAHDTRTDTRSANVAPEGAAVAPLSASDTVSRTAPEKLADPAFTLESCPVPTVLPFTSTSASRS